MKPVRAFAAEDGSLHATVAGARQHELWSKLSGHVFENGDKQFQMTPEQAQSVARWLVDNSQSVVSLLQKGGVTGTPRTATKPRRRKPAPESAGNGGKPV